MFPQGGFFLCFPEQIEGTGAAVADDDGEICISIEAIQPHLTGSAGGIIAAGSQQRIPDPDGISFCGNYHNVVAGVGEDTDSVLPVTGCDFDETYMPNRTQIRM